MRSVREPFLTLMTYDTVAPPDDDGAVQETVRELPLPDTRSDRTALGLPTFVTTLVTAVEMTPIEVEVRAYIL